MMLCSNTGKAIRASADTYNKFLQASASIQRKQNNFSAYFD